MKPQDEALSVTQADYEMAEQYRDRHGLNGLSRDHLADLIAHVRLSHSTPGDAEVRKALEDADKALVDMSDQWTSGWYDSAGMYAHDVARKAEVDAKKARLSIAKALSALATPSGRAQAWLPIEDAPRDGTEIVAAIKVRHIKGGMWWERHVIAADEETGELHPDYDHGWAFDDYELWMSLADLPDLPAAPPAQDQGDKQ